MNETNLSLRQKQLINIIGKSFNGIPHEDIQEKLKNI
jgi:hypothetical protein